MCWQGVEREEKCRGTQCRFCRQPWLDGFGWMGQCSRLVVGTAPERLMREIARLTFRWLAQMDDLSGLEGGWRKPDEARGPIVEQLLAFAGQVSFPFLLANAQAVSVGTETFSFSALGMSYEQGAFQSQVTCLGTFQRIY